MNINPLRTLLATLGLVYSSSSHAATVVLYTQDFSDLTSLTTTNALNLPLTAGTLYTPLAGETITKTGGNNYTITIDTVGGQTAGYVFDAGAAGVPYTSNDPGFAYDDARYTFLTSSIGFTAGGMLYNGTVTLASQVNVGDEFISLNKVEVTQDDVTEEVIVTVDYNGFGDFATGATDSFFLTTNFGLAADLTNFDLTNDNGIVGANQSIAESQSFTLFAPIPEPTALTFIGLAGFAFVARRKR